MDLLPNAELSDNDVAETLARVIAVVDPLLDLLAKADPIGLRERTRHLGDGSGPVNRTLDSAAWVLNAADAPGTASWDGMNLDDRVHWWTRRIGALNTVLVAAPGVFGALLKRLPMRDLLGFANQSIVLCAVAREYGVTDEPTRVRLLADVLCRRTLPQQVAVALDPEPEPEPEPTPSKWRPAAVAQTLWHIVGILRAAGTEVAKRPQPRRFFRWLGMLPVIGAIATYFGELGALSRTVRAGRGWLDAYRASQPQAPEAGVHNPG